MYCVSLFLTIKWILGSLHREAWVHIDKAIVEVVVCALNEVLDPRDNCYPAISPSICVFARAAMALLEALAMDLLPKDEYYLE
jgi:hypothetical protein